MSKERYPAKRKEAILQKVHREPSLAPLHFRPLPEADIATPVYPGDGPSGVARGGRRAPIDQPVGIDVSRTQFPEGL